MKKNISFRNDVPDPRSPAQFWWAVPAAMAIGSAISALSSSSANSENVEAQERINERNIENQWKMFGAMNNRQDYLNANQASIYRNSMSKAGLNLNSDLGGFSPNMATNSAPSAEAKAPTVNPIFDSSLGATMAQMVQQTPLVNSQARKNNAEAKAQEIENEREEQSDTVLRNYILEQQQEGVDTNELLPGTQLDELVVSGKPRKYNKGTFESLKAIREYKSKVKELTAKDAKNALDELVANDQLHDSRVVEALRKMPYAEYRELGEKIRNLVKDRQVMESVIKYNNAQGDLATEQKELVEIEKKIRNNSDMSQIIHKYLGDGPLADFAMFLILFVNQVSAPLMGAGAKFIK